MPTTHLRWLLWLLWLLRLSLLAQVPTAHAQQCTLCAENTVCFLERNTSCPAFSTAPAGTGSVDACVCTKGFFRESLHDSVTCQPCLPGKYCMNQVVHDCPEHSTSPDQASKVSDCYCLSGYTGSNGEACQACPAGTFKTDSGAAGCTPCAENSYSTATARTSQCDSCPEGHVSDAGSSKQTACVSAPGWYTGQAWHWADKRMGVWQCPFGTYQTARAQSTCLQCVSAASVVPAVWYEDSSGLWMPAFGPLTSVSSSECVQCGAKSVLAKIKVSTGAYPTISFSPEMCICEPGYEDIDGASHVVTCTTCRQGKHQPAYTGVCVNCLADSYPATPPTQCTSCPSASSAPAGSADVSSCACIAGHQGSPPGAVACTPCAAGLISTGPTSDRTCQACQTGKYASSASAATSCTACTADASSPAASDSITDCTCNAGFQMSFQTTVGTCLPCVPGQYNPSSNSACRPCGPNTYSIATGQTVCTDCPANSAYASIAAMSVLSCACDPGYTSGGEQQHCLPCEAGKAKTAPGFDACTPCAKDTYSAAAAASCESCGAHSSTLGLTGQTGFTSATACACDAGYELVNGICVQCREYYFKASPGNGACVPCSPGSISAADHTSCQQCRANTYQPGVGACLSCASNAVSEAGSTSGHQCLCDAGYFRRSAATDGNPTCEQCVQGSFKTSASHADCTACPSGWTTPGAGSTSDDCQACAANQYVVYGAENPIPKRTCASCAANKQSPPASTSIDSCQCNAGHTGPDGQTACTVCPAGTYKDGVGNAPCTTCPDGKKSTQTGATYTACTNCEAGTYSQNFGGTRCESCQANSFSDAGSTSVGACRCNAGWQLETGICASCAAGTYKSAGMLNCQSCADDTYSASSSSAICLACATNAQHNTARQACECKPGYECTAQTATPATNAPPEGCDCVPCQAGSYRTLSTDARCLQCPANTYYPADQAPGTLFILNRCQSCPPNSKSRAGAYGIAGCTCEAGFHREGDACQPCTANFFCPDEATRVPCVDNSVSPAGSVSLLACQCVPGLYGDMAREPVCHLCPLNSYCAGGQDVTACPEHSTTHGVYGMVLRASCECQPGYYNESFSGLCVQCPPQTFCANEAKYRCPHNASSAKGSIICVCDPDFRTHNATSTPLQLRCEACPPDAVCRGGNDWERCSTGALNVHGRRVCVCAAGSACKLEDSVSCHPPSTCDACPADHYCADNTRRACPLQSSAPANASRISQCLCNAGHYRVGDTDTCQPCLAGSYCIDQTQFMCTALDANLVGQNDLAVSSADCICALGYFRTSTEDRCQLCPQDFYCPSEATEGVINVYACFEHAHTKGPGKWKVESCACGAGLKFSSEGGSSACLPCDVGSRCSSGELAPVACSHLNREPNAEHTACVCLPGFYATTEEGTCQACDAGHSKPAPGDGACEPCPANTWARNTTTCAACPPRASATPGSSSCACTFGFKQSGTQANLQCDPCTAGTYFTGEAGASGECLQCPAHANTRNAAGAVGMQACLCEPGYVRGSPGAAFCVACPLATYESAGVCVPCGGGRFAPTASPSEAACVCNATACQRTWQKTCFGACEVRPAPCRECRPGTFKPANSTQGNRETCGYCPPSTYQAQPQSTECIACHGTREHLTTGQADVEHCVCRAGFEPADAAPETVSTRHNNAACQQCQPGFHKPQRGNHLCHACPRDSFANSTGRTSCTKCADAAPAFSNAMFTARDASTAASDCTCNAGFTLEAGLTQEQRCVQCTRGSFKPLVGMGLCELCGLGAQVNQYGHSQKQGSNALHCVDCPRFSGQAPSAVTRAVPMDDISRCVCFPGHHQWTNETCSPCPQYQYKLGFSNEACQTCADAFYFVHKAVRCQPCTLQVSFCGANSYWRARHTTLLPTQSTMRRRLHAEEQLAGGVGQAVVLGACYKADSHSVAVNLNDARLRWGTSSDDCECDLGHERMGELCEECIAGYYRGAEVSVFSQRHCSKCPPAHFQPLTGSPACVPCPPFSSHVNGSQATGRATCLCDAGYFWREVDMACVACEAGKYKARPARTLSEISETETAQANTAPCQTCPANTYAQQTAAECTACGANMFSDAGARAFDQCFCNAGFGDAGTQAGPGPTCECCPNGTFWAGARVQRQACTACPQHKTSPPGSIASSACRCVRGHGVAASSPESTPCEACVSGTFSVGGVGNANAPCVSCGWGTVTEPALAAPGPESCMCNAAAGLIIQAD